jgi:hypothetical protein
MVKLKTDVSVQISTDVNKYAKIYKTLACEDYLIENGHNPDDYPKTFTEDFVVIQYLKDCGYDAAIYTIEDKEKKYPTFTTAIIGHFAFVDMLGMFNDQMQEYCCELFQTGQLQFDKRTIVSKSKFQDCLTTPFIINIDGVEYQWVFKVVDTIGVVGPEPFGKVCTLAGVDNPHKELGKNNIHDTLNWLIKKPDEFTKYALGDLKTGECLYNINKMMGDVYKSLGLKQNKEIKLTIGSTVSELINTSVLNFLCGDSSKPLNNKNPYYKALSNATPKYLKSNTRCQISKLAKVVGGRCHNNNPLFDMANYGGKTFHDIDITGAYATAMKTLSLPVGHGVVCGMLNGRNAEISLNKFLSMFNKNLIREGWTAVFDAQLKLNQDLFPTWQGAKGKTEITLKGKEYVLDERSGNMTVYNKFIKDGVLTSDLLDVINISFSPQQKADFYKNVKIKAFVVYPKSMEVGLDTFNKNIDSKLKKHTFKLNLPKYWVREDAPNNLFTRRPLGSLLINKLSLLRGKYDKNNPKEEPFNKLYKLITNVCYGSFVSSFFKVSNVVVSNNITARVRVGMWVTEKAANMVGCITDGAVTCFGKVFYKYDMNKTYVPNSQYLPKLYSMSRKELVQKKVGYLKPICENWESMTWVQLCEQLKKHIAKIFPIPLITDNYSIVTSIVDNVIIKQERKGLFNFEVKKSHKTFVMQGKANYCLGDNINECKIRSAQIKREHQGYDLKAEELVPTNIYSTHSPHQQMLLNIKNQPTHCPFMLPCAIDKILKPKEYCNHQHKYLNLVPSDTYLQVVHVNYISISQFTFKNPQQRKNWERDYNYLKRKYSESFNLFFINQDGTFNYKKCLHGMDTAINAGVMSPLKHFDKHNNLHRLIPDVVKKHHKIKSILKERIDIIYKADPQKLYD